MLSEQKVFFTKENLDTCLKEVAREYRKLGGKAMPAELILIGGASVLINYGFRDMTTDVDAIIRSASCMKDAINRVGDRLGLPNGWLNSDFTRTGSYSPKLVQYSTYYKTFSNVLTVRTIAAEYLIAMKLRSGRQYKNDLSDVLGILAEHEKQGRPITMEQIRLAVVNLYGDWAELSAEARDFIENVMRDGGFDVLYAEVTAGEQESKSILLDFEQQYPGVANHANMNDILRDLRKRQGTQAESPPKKPSVLSKLQHYKSEQKDTAPDRRSKDRGINEH